MARLVSWGQRSGGASTGQATLLCAQHHQSRRIIQQPPQEQVLETGAAVGAPSAFRRLHHVADDFTPAQPLRRSQVQRRVRGLDRAALSMAWRSVHRRRRRPFLNDRSTECVLRARSRQRRRRLLVASRWCLASGLDGDDGGDSPLLDPLGVFASRRTSTAVLLSSGANIRAVVTEVCLRLRRPLSSRRRLQIFATGSDHHHERDCRWFRTTRSGSISAPQDARCCCHRAQQVATKAATATPQCPWLGSTTSRAVALATLPTPGTLEAQCRRLSPLTALPEEAMLPGAPFSLSASRHGFFTGDVHRRLDRGPRTGRRRWRRQRVG
jgi:hypothetical protein